jgi:hypothetical protein
LSKIQQSIAIKKYPSQLSSIKPPSMAEPKVIYIVIGKDILKNKCDDIMVETHTKIAIIIIEGNNNFIIFII